MRINNLNTYNNSNGRCKRMLTTKQMNFKIGIGYIHKRILKRFFRIATPCFYLLLYAL